MHIAPDLPASAVLSLLRQRKTLELSAFGVKATASSRNLAHMIGPFRERGLGYDT